MEPPRPRPADVIAGLVVCALAAAYTTWVVLMWIDVGMHEGVVLGLLAAWSVALGGVSIMRQRGPTWVAVVFGVAVALPASYLLVLHALGAVLR